MADVPFLTIASSLLPVRSTLFAAVSLLHSDDPHGGGSSRGAGEGADDNEVESVTKSLRNSRICGSRGRRSLFFFFFPSALLRSARSAGPHSSPGQTTLGRGRAAAKKKDTPTREGGGNFCFFQRRKIALRKEKVALHTVLAFLVDVLRGSPTHR